MVNLETRLFALERALQSARWRSGAYTEIQVKSPKRRVVSAAPFCRVGKGTHRAIARYEQYSNRYKHVLRADIFRYFPAIDHAVLKQNLRRRIACPKTLWLLDTLIDGSNPQKPVYQFYPGDDLLSVAQRFPPSPHAPMRQSRLFYGKAGCALGCPRFVMIRAAKLLSLWLRI